MSREHLQLSQPTPLREALARVDEDGRFALEDADSVRSIVHRFVDSGENPDLPSQLFGPWSEVGMNAQSAFRRMVEDEISGTMGVFPQGSIWNGMIRGGWELDRYLAESGFLAQARDSLIRWICRLRDGPMELRKRHFLRKQEMAWRDDAAPTLTALLVGMGKTPRWLLGDFVEGVGVDPRARGYYHNPRSNLTYGYNVALDLMFTDEGVFCLEGNLQREIGNMRHAVQPDHPTERGIIQAAKAHGARRVFWMEGHILPIRSWFMRRLKQEGLSEGIRVEFFDDPGKRRTRGYSDGLETPNRRAWLESPPEDTLVVRRNTFPVGSDFVLNHKEPFVRGLDAVLTEWGETRVGVLRQTGVPPHVDVPSPNGLPNLVYKYPDGMGGKEVFFLRAADKTHALSLARDLDSRHQRGPGVFQPFAFSKLLPGRRVFDFSSEIFISPRGTWFLGSMRRDASKPVPMDNRLGLLDEPGTLTSNLGTGGTLTRVEGEELEAVKEASMVVGNALREVLDRTFQTEPPQHEGGH